MQIPSLSQAPPPTYEALSYVWGNSTVTLPILLNGLEFQVTTNLESALRHLRYHDRTRILWADAICIDQNDIGERGTWALQMDRVYGEVQEVIVWLGGMTERLVSAETV